MTDREALDFLVARLSNKSRVAEALGVSAQRLNNWYDARRGISASKRAAVWSMVNDNGGNLTRDWLIEAAAPPKKRKAA